MQISRLRLEVEAGVHFGRRSQVRYSHLVKIGARQENAFEGARNSTASYDPSRRRKIHHIAVNQLWREGGPTGAQHRFRGYQKWAGTS